MRTATATMIPKKDLGFGIAGRTAMDFVIQVTDAATGANEHSLTSLPFLRADPLHPRVFRENERQP